MTTKKKKRYKRERDSGGNHPPESRSFRLVMRSGIPARSDLGGTGRLVLTA